MSFKVTEVTNEKLLLHFSNNTINNTNQYENLNWKEMTEIRK